MTTPVARPEPDIVRDGRLVATKAWELEAAGWVEPANGTGEPWTVTPLGRAIREVRIVPGADHIVAECGDDDEPRHLGEAWKTRVGWLVKVGTLHVAANTVHQAREELRHMAAVALAADPTFTTVQEGQTQP